MSNGTTPKSFLATHDLKQMSLDHLDESLCICIK